MDYEKWTNAITALVEINKELTAENKNLNTENGRLLCKTEGELSWPEHFFDHMEPDYLSFRDPARKIRDYCKDRVWCFDNKSICKYFINRKCILRNYIKGGCNPCNLYPWECEIIDKARGLKE